METLLLWNEQLDLFFRWLFGSLYGTWWIPIIWIGFTMFVTAFWMMFENQKMDREIKELEKKHLIS